MPNRIFIHREGAVNLNDMKDMLANLPQYQEQREKVSSALRREDVAIDLVRYFPVLVAFEHGPGVYGYLRARQAAGIGDCRTGTP